MKRTHALTIVILVFVCTLLCVSLTAMAAVDLDKLQTPAEASNWTRTTSSAEVYEFCQTVAENSGGRIIMDYTYITELGTKIPYLIVGNPAPAVPVHLFEEEGAQGVRRPLHPFAHP